MLYICESFGIEYDVLWNPSKSICIDFPGTTTYKGDPPTVTLNEINLKYGRGQSNI